MKLSKMHPKDADYFLSFAKNAMAANRSLECHYTQSQISHTGTFLEKYPFGGLRHASDFLTQNMSILLAGCGPGSEAKYLLDRGFKNITGLDVNETLLGRFTERFNLPTICANMCNTGLPACSFDAVITHCSLHHLFYPFRAMEEIARIAKTMVCFADEPVKSAIKFLYRAAFKQGRIISDANIYEYQFDIEDVQRHMLFNGFECKSLKRFWISGEFNSLPINILNYTVPFLGNRFSGVFFRMASK